MSLPKLLAVIAAMPRMADSLRAGSLRLDVFTREDLLELHAIFSDPETHVIGEGPVGSIEETRDWLERRDLRRKEHGVTWYAVRDGGGRLIGNAGLFMGRTAPHPELGFEIRRSEQNRGYGRTAAAAVVGEAHRAGFGEVWATVRDWNVSSLRALSVVGFERERVEMDDRGGLIYLRHGLSES
jgi:ribosomal-protein-alanine N-acetyltransferase